MCLYKKNRQKLVCVDRFVQRFLKEKTETVAYLEISYRALEDTFQCLNFYLKISLKVH